MYNKISVNPSKKSRGKAISIMNKKTPNEIFYSLGYPIMLWLQSIISTCSLNHRHWILVFVCKNTKRDMEYQCKLMQLQSNIYSHSKFLKTGHTLFYMFTYMNLKYKDIIINSIMDHSNTLQYYL